MLTAIFFVLLFASSRYLSKLNNFTLYDSLTRSSPIDGMRGILALSVMTHHFSIIYLWKTQGEWRTPESAYLENLGSVGVSLFFLTTGYLFLNKIRKPQINWAELYISRFWRIYPLFFFVSILVVLITFISINKLPNNINSLKFILNWFLFMGGDIDTFRSSQIIAGVHWTLIYEWCFYFILPFIYMVLHKRFVNVLVLILCAIPIVLILSITGKKIYLLFFLSYFSIYYSSYIKHLIDRYKSICNFLIVLLLFFTMCFTHTYSIVQQILVAIIFAFIANGLTLNILQNKGLKILGDISYSIYLMHGLVLYFIFTVLDLFDFSKSLYAYLLFYPLIFALTLLVSVLTHKYIEKKFLVLYKTKKSLV